MRRIKYRLLYSLSPPVKKKVAVRTTATLILTSGIMLLVLAHPGGRIVPIRGFNVNQTVMDPRLLR
jgi:hypothetical protein